MAVRRYRPEGWLGLRFRRTHRVLTTATTRRPPSTRLLRVPPHRGARPPGRGVHARRACAPGGVCAVRCLWAASARLLRLPPVLEGGQPGLRRQHLVDRHPHGQRQRDRRRAPGHQPGAPPLRAPPAPRGAGPRGAAPAGAAPTCGTARAGCARRPRRAGCCVWVPARPGRHTRPGHGRCSGECRRRPAGGTGWPGRPGG